MDLYDIPSLSFEADLSVLFYLHLHEDLELLRTRNQRMRNKILSNIEQLPIPNVLKERLSINAINVEYSLRHWIRLWCAALHNNKHHEQPWWLNNGNLHKHVTWNSLGIVDAKKTAENILNSESFSPEDGFRLASINFVEEKVTQIWPQVRHFFLDLNEDSEASPTKYWISHCKNKDQAQFHSVDFYAELITCVEYRNYPGVSYFLPRTPQLQVNDYCQYLGTEATWRSITSILLISVLSFQQRKHLFTNFPELLYQFLEWPFQYSFMKVVRLYCDDLWPVLDTYQFADLLAIVHRNCEILSYPSSSTNLLSEFYMCAPVSLRINYFLVCVGSEFESQYLNAFNNTVAAPSAVYFFTRSPAIQALQNVFTYNAAALCEFFNTEKTWDTLRNFALKYLFNDLDEITSEFLNTSSRVPARP